MAFGSTIKDLRQRNRARVLRSIVLSGETTRAQLAASCHLSTATITNVVTQLMSDGLVQEIGSVPSDGGRPIARLSVRPAGAYVIGADVGENDVMVELFDLGLETVDRVQGDIPTTIADVDEVSKALTQAVETLLERHSDRAGPLIGMGLGIPGLVERTADGRTTIFAESIGWPPTELADLCTIDGLPIYADNGANTMTIAEQWLGAIRGVDHALVVLIGRGIGAGVITDGRLLRGTSNSAGEWGHTKIDAAGRRCTCGDNGCLEAYVGGGGIAARWREQGGHGGDSEQETFAKLLEAHASGDQTATAVIDESIELLGIGLANGVNLLNPKKVVIGGWAGLPLHALRGNELAAAVNRHALGRPARQVTVEACAMGSDAVALGAALLPFERLIEGTLDDGTILAEQGSIR